VADVTAAFAFNFEGKELLKENSDLSPVFAAGKLAKLAENIVI
jgi:hypothetical protein